MIDMKKIGTKELLYALISAAVAFAVSFMISYKSAEKSARGSVAELVENQDIHEIISQIKLPLPMDVGTGIIWTDMTFENDTVIYHYKFSGLYADDIDKELIESVKDDDKKLIIQSLVSEYESSSDSKIWIDLIIRNQYKLLYSYNDCQSEFIYSITILPSELEEALKM